MKNKKNAKYFKKAHSLALNQILFTYQSLIHSFKRNLQHFFFLFSSFSFHSFCLLAFSSMLFIMEL